MFNSSSKQQFDTSSSSSHSVGSVVYNDYNLKYFSNSKYNYKHQPTLNEEESSRTDLDTTNDSIFNETICEDENIDNNYELLMKYDTNNESSTKSFQKRNLIESHNIPYNESAPIFNQENDNVLNLNTINNETNLNKIRKITHFINSNKDIPESMEFSSNFNAKKRYEKNSPSERNSSESHSSVHYLKVPKLKKRTLSHETSPEYDYASEAGSDITYDTGSGECDSPVINESSWKTNTFSYMCACKKVSLKIFLI